MNEYITKEQAVSICTAYEDLLHIVNGYRDSASALTAHYIGVEIGDLPAADVAEVKHGKWIPHIEEDYIGAGQYGYIELLKCSECGTLVPNKRNFCHHCGAKMDTV